MVDEGSAVRVRLVGGDEIELVIDRRLRFFCEMRGWTLDEMPDDFLVANRAFVERTHGRSFHTWVAEDGDECLGVVSLVVSDAPPRPEELRDRDGYIINMHVEPTHRSRGIGRLLVDACMAGCHEMGVRRISLYATDDGRPLYESIGFADEPGWMNLYL